MRRRRFTTLALGTMAAAVALPLGALAAPDDAATPTPELRSLGDDIALELPGGKKMYGSLTLPRVAKLPVVLIVPAAGPIDRNGNTARAGLSTDVYAYLAAALRDRGIASLRYDKRGVGESSSVVASEVEVRFGDYAQDAERWVTKLRADRRFRAVGIVGHSEGSLIGMVAAAATPVESFVSIAGAGRPLGESLREQLRPTLAKRPELLAASERIIDALVRGQTTTDVPPELNALFRPSVQPFLISIVTLDPRVAIKHAGKHAAIVQGTADLQVSEADARALAAARPDATLTIVPNMTHVLKIATDPRPEVQVATVFTDASIPLAVAVPDAIAAIVRP